MMRVFLAILTLIHSFVLSAAAMAEALEVDVIYPRLESNNPPLKLVGTVEATQHAQVASEQAGRVEQIYVEVGDFVEQGQSLLQLDDSLAKLSALETASRVEAAKVALTEARRLLNDVETLSERKVIAATLVEERRAQVASAAAVLSQEQATLAYRNKLVDKHRLIAPFSGLVEHRAVSLGEWLTSQSVPFRMISSDALRVRVHIPQEYYFSLRSAQMPKVEIQHNKLSSPITGLTIDRLVPVSQQLTRSMPALIDLPAGSQLIPGMSADVRITLEANGTNLAWVPVSAIKIHPDGGNSLVAVENDKAKRRKVSIVEDRGSVVLVRGITNGEPVITSSIEFVTDGMAVRIANTREFEL